MKYLIIVTVLLVTPVFGQNVSIEHNGFTYERSGDVQYGEWHECKANVCRHINTPTNDFDFTYLKEVPDEAETVARGFPPTIAEKAYSCKRYGGWVCSQDHCSSNWRYSCSPNSGFERAHREEGEQGPDGAFYIGAR